MKVTARILTGLTPDALLQHHPPPEHPQTACGEEKGWCHSGHLQHLCSWNRLTSYFEYSLRGKCVLVHPPPLPKGDPAHLAHQLLWLPYKHPAWQHPGETLDMAQECVCSHLLRIKNCKIYFSQQTNSPNSALMKQKQILPRTPSRQNCTITS